MNKKEVNEIRRRLKPEKNSISHIYGCFVNPNKELVSYIDESSAMLTQEENERYLSILKKTLSGRLGRNLHELSFATKQIMDSDEVRLLSRLRKTELKDAELREEFFRCVTESVSFEDSGFVILLAYDAYDVPRYGKDDSREDSGEVFRYLICCVCPVKEGKIQFGYSDDDKRFEAIPPFRLMAAPELGFMYPSFDERTTNIYSALFYSRSTRESHREFIDAVFRTGVPMPASEQTEAFGSAVKEALDRDCSFELMQSVHSELTDMISAHKESRDPEKLTITPEELGDIIESSGASPEQAELFEEKCREQFGGDAELCPENLIDCSHFRLKTGDIKISIPPQLSGLVEMRRIDGKNYILIPADAGIELNGMNVFFGKDKLT